MLMLILLLLFLCGVECVIGVGLFVILLCRGWLLSGF